MYEGRRAGTREEPGTLTQGAPVFPGSSRLGIEPKTPGWLVQDPTTWPIGDLIPTIRGSGAHPGRGFFFFLPSFFFFIKEFNESIKQVNVPWSMAPTGTHCRLSHRQLTNKPRHERTRTHRTHSLVPPGGSNFIIPLLRSHNGEPHGMPPHSAARRRRGTHEAMCSRSSASTSTSSAPCCRSSASISREVEAPPPCQALAKASGVQPNTSSALTSAPAPRSAWASA